MIILGYLIFVSKSNYIEDYKLLYLQISVQMSEEQQQAKRIQRTVLELNKTGLLYLASKQMNAALDYLKKAEKTIVAQLKINSTDANLNKLGGITFNNLACYYKKNNKPKVALGYLKKALELQVYKAQDLISTASTHLNICALYSYLQKQPYNKSRHQQAAQHAQMTISILEKTSQQQRNQLKTERQSKHNEYQQPPKSFHKLLMLGNYNLGIQLQYLKKFEESIQHYNKAKQIAIEFIGNKKDNNIKTSCEEAIERVKQAEKNQRKKLLDLLNKKKHIEEVGNYQYMCKNKKHFKNKGQISQYDIATFLRKFKLYRAPNSGRKVESSSKQYSSLEKIKKLQPLVDHKTNQIKKSSVLIKMTDTKNA